MSGLLIALIQPLLIQLITKIWPKAPVAIGKILAQAIPATIELVGELADDDDLDADTDGDGKISGEEKQHAVVDATKEFLDTALDKLPEWREVGERKRHVMLTGLAEFAHWMLVLEDKKGGSANQVMRKLKKGLKKRGRKR